MQKIFSLPGCLKELSVTVKWAVHLHAVYRVFQPALPEKSWTQTVTLIEGWWAWMLGYILFIIPWPFVLLGWHWLCKPPSVSKVLRRACYSLKQAVAVPTPQPQDLHRVPHAAEHREHPSHIPVGCWMYSPTSTWPAVLKKEVPESLRDIVFPMSRCLQLSAGHVFSLLSVTWNLPLYCLCHICQRLPNLLQETLSGLRLGKTFLGNPWNPIRSAALHQYGHAQPLG